MACRIQNQLLVFLCTALIFSCSGKPADFKIVLYDIVFFHILTIVLWLQRYAEIGVRYFRTFRVHPRIYSKDDAMGGPPLLNIAI